MASPAKRVGAAILGLGNPGSDYAATRHNLGFMVLDRLSQAHHLTFGRARSRVRTAEGEIAGCRVVLAKPTTYMNLSGLAAERMVRKYHLEPQDILVVCDDLNLPLGRFRLRQQGSDGGHNGLASVIYSLGSEGFPRLRLGIGPLEPEADQVRFVLEPFRVEEVEEAERMIGEAVECLEVYLERGPEAAMSRFNRDPVT